MVLGTRLRIAIRRTSNQLDLGLPLLIFNPKAQVNYARPCWKQSAGKTMQLTSDLKEVYMSNKLLSKVSMLAMPVMIASCLLASNATAMAQSNFRHCSDRTLSGDYGYAAEGLLLPAPGVSLQFRSVGLTTFDGKGNLSWLESTVIDGKLLEPGWTKATGTYTVNSDCTGTAVVFTPNSVDPSGNLVPLNLAFLVVKQGREVHSVLGAHAISTTFTKVE
jgi:hypothetical protein